MKKFKSVVSFLFVCFFTFLSFGFAVGVNSDTENISAGDIIEYGYYPQTKVTDSALLSKLNSLALDWVSYEYCYGDGKAGSMVKSDYMRYADVMFENEKYRAVFFDHYRPWHTFTKPDGNTYQDDNGYEAGQIYWFKYEPIQWRVLDPDEGFVMSEMILDSQAFSDFEYKKNGIAFNNEEMTVRSYDYETSTIRQWLNNTFFSTAFSEKERAAVKTSLLDNSCPDDPKYSGNSTYDKVFIMSFSDIYNSSYGFSISKNNDEKRIGCGTDYAKCQGLMVSKLNTSAGNSYWHIRTVNTVGYTTSEIGLDGSVMNGSTTTTCNGIRPAMRIDFDYNDTYEISWVVDSSVTTVEAEVGAKITVPENPFKQGYVFAGWTPDIPDVMPSENLVFTAVFNKIFVCEKCGKIYTDENKYNTHLEYEDSLVIDAEITIVNSSGCDTLNYGETAAFYIVSKGLPQEAHIKWRIISGRGVTLEPSVSGKICNVTTKNTCDIVIEAYAVNSNGRKYVDNTGEKISDREGVKSEAGLMQRIIFFIKKLFKM